MIKTAIFQKGMANPTQEKQQGNGTVLSGMRPTGNLHIGHFEGVLRNWVELQNNFNCFYFVADWHALTTDLNTREIRKHSIEMVRDWLAFGVDPKKSTIFVQSCVPEHTELSLILERIINIGTLERMPTFKAYIDHLAGERKIREKGILLEGEERLEFIAKSEISLGFLAYPVLQAADILLYNTTHVPVGEDQLPHIELTREIARKFNRTYGELFEIPEALIGEAKRVRGTDGRKMSKSYDNDISPAHSEEEISKKIKQITTNRKRLSDCGDPYECPVFDLHRIYNQEGEIDISKACRSASIKCVDCKLTLPEMISATYKVYRENKTAITDEEIIGIIREGNEKARRVTQKTVQRVKHFMLLEYV